ncbi:MAG: acylneuraminate cytidylyltransferase family protein [Methanobacteriaceae archaeon]|nr:acylneuraminate cytidylyltransferase family protein [Methanobacteriaceae archaeon]
MENIISVIPARGGSKGLLRKNVKSIAGTQLITYSINAANNSKYIKNSFISTEDPEIESISKNCGFEVIKRPETLAKDNSLTIDVILHSLDFFEEKGAIIDLLVLLQPTSPLRTSIDIDNAIELYINNDCESVISVSELEHSPYWSLKLQNSYLIPSFGKEYFEKRRQDLPTLYSPNGAIFISKPEYLRKHKTFYSEKTLPYIMPPERSIDIDTELDFKLAELILKERKENE